ncbi:tetratricopeptide repeat protein [Corynebacterium suedekumii]|nr:tetratricopeptide repeat protein [Corynebacterium suedekumii]
MAENQIEMAVAALDKVPQASRHHRMAKLTTILQLISGTLTESRIRRAAQPPRGDPHQRAPVSADQDRRHVRGPQLPPGRRSRILRLPNDLFEYHFTQRGLRAGLAETLRLQARQAPFAKHRYALVDMANQVRPVTWF